VHIETTGIPANKKIIILSNRQIGSKTVKSKFPGLNVCCKYKFHCRGSQDQTDSCGSSVGACCTYLKNSDHQKAKQKLWSALENRNPSANDNGDSPTRMSAATTRRHPARPETKQKRQEPNNSKHASVSQPCCDASEQRKKQVERQPPFPYSRLLKRMHRQRQADRKNKKKKKMG